MSRAAALVKGFHWHKKRLENTQRTVAGFQNSTVYLQQSGRECGDLILQTAHSCQVYRPWVMPGEHEPRGSPAHLLPQRRGDPRVLSGAGFCPFLLHRKHSLWDGVSEAWGILPSLPRDPGSSARSRLGLKMLASCFGACHSGATAYRADGHL